MRSLPPQPFIKGPIFSDFQPVILEEATIVFVNEKDLLCTIVTNSHRICDNVPIVPLYSHYLGAYGAVVPEPGAMCIVAWPTSGYVPRILCYMTPPTDEGATDKPKVLAENIPARAGDLYFRTSSGAFLHVTASGFASIGATPLAQITFSPDFNFTSLVSENFELLSPAGSFEFKTKRISTTGNPQTVSTFKFKADIATPPVFEMSIGTVSSNPLEILIAKGGDTFSLTLDRLGMVKTTMLSLDLTAKTTVNINAPIVSIGQGASIPVARSVPIITILSGLMTTLSTTIGSLKPDAFPPGSPAQGAAITAITALQSQLATIPSPTVTVP